LIAGPPSRSLPWPEIMTHGHVIGWSPCSAARMLEPVQAAALQPDVQDHQRRPPGAEGGERLVRIGRLPRLIALIRQDALDQRGCPARRRRSGCHAPWSAPSRPAAAPVTGESSRACSGTAPESFAPFGATRQYQQRPGAGPIGPVLQLQPATMVLHDLLARWRGRGRCPSHRVGDIGLGQPVPLLALRQAPMPLSSTSTAIILPPRSCTRQADARAPRRRPPAPDAPRRPRRSSAGWSGPGRSAGVAGQRRQAGPACSIVVLDVGMRARCCSTTLGAITWSMPVGA
jgi:hypothetical protein